MERRLTILRVLYKLVITTCFVFDKKGEIRGYVGLVCFCLCAIIIFKRCTSALIYKRSVYYATIIYEASSTWLYLAVSMHILTDSKITVMILGEICAIAIILSVVLCVYQDRKRNVQLQTVHPDRFTDHSEYERYFYRLYETIEGRNSIAHNEFLGILYNHVHYCENGPTCPCVNIIETYDGIKKYRQLMQKEREEQQQIAIQQRLDRESSLKEKQLN